MRDLESRTGAILSLNKAIRLFNQGDAKAFEFIYRSYRDFVHRICLRMLRDSIEAEDAAQDVFLCVFCKINTFRGESAFSSWLYRLTTNSVLMRLRKKKHTWIPLEEAREAEGGSCWENSAADSNPSGLLDRIDIQSAVEVLPKGYKAAFMLHDIQGYDHREIAEMCGHSIGNSKSQLHKARLRLRKLLRGMPQEGVQQDTNQLLCTKTPNSPVKKKVYAAPFGPTGGLFARTMHGYSIGTVGRVLLGPSHTQRQGTQGGFNGSQSLQMHCCESQRFLQETTINVREDCRCDKN